MPVLRVDWEVGLVRIPPGLWPTVVIMPDETRLEGLSESILVPRRDVDEVVRIPYTGRQERLAFPLQEFNTRLSDGTINGWAVYSRSYELPVLVCRLRSKVDLKGKEMYVLDTPDVYAGRRNINQLPGVGDYCDEHDSRMYKDESSGRLFCPVCTRL